MGDVVNLNEYRKQRARRDAARRAAEKRVKFSGSREERKKANPEAERDDLDGKGTEGGGERDGAAGPDDIKH